MKMKKSISNTIQSAFGVVNGMMIVVAAIGIVALVVVRHSANTAMHAGARLNAIGLEIQASSLLARGFEKDFLLNIKVEGVESSKQHYANKVPPIAAGIEQLAAEGSGIATAAADRERLRAIPPLARAYSIGFADVVAAKEKRGHVDSGAEGQFREAAHRIEAEVRNLDKLEIALLTLRRGEKDYLLRGQDQYIAATIENVKKFKAAVDLSPLSPAQKDTARKSADVYQAAFLALVAADREVAAKTAVYAEATQRLQAFSDQVAQAGFQASQASLASASLVAWVSILVTVLVSLAAVAAGVSYGRRISAHITGPVKHLTDIAGRVSMGDVSLKVEHTCDDEIGDLEDSLARLVAAVKFYQSESEESQARSEAPAGVAQEISK